MRLKIIAEIEMISPAKQGNLRELSEQTLVRLLAATNDVKSIQVKSVTPTMDAMEVVEMLKEDITIMQDDEHDKVLSYNYYEKMFYVRGKLRDTLSFAYTEDAVDAYNSI